jgi:integrating conjugative element protein (TIGR03752 family)
MAIKQNTLLPILGILTALIVTVILWQQFSGPDTNAPGEAMKAVPAPAELPPTKGADADNAGETLKTVVASNDELRKQVAEIVARNKKLEEEEAKRLQRQGSAPGAPNSSGDFGSAVDAAGQAADSLMGSLPTLPNSPKPGAQVGRTVTGGTAAPIIGEMPLGAAEQAAGAVAYKTVAPMGYSAFEDTRSRNQGPPSTRYVRTNASARTSADTGSTGAATALAGGGAEADKSSDEAFFTLPENSTLVGVKAMTAIIGRVPIDGRVTDPMQFKLIVGRENLAANGWELPEDIAGMILSGVAIGDMALSCSEGKIRSATFVFNDGAIRTVSSRGRGSAAGSGGDLGYISDPRGNPCIVGKFVTNAPAYLTDIIGAKTLGVAGQAYADAAKLVTQNALGSTTTQITDTSRFVLGQAVSGATDEFTAWLLSRLKNSFDAVVTPSGNEVVVHLDQELRLDKAAMPRKLTHRAQTTSNAQRGGIHGLE